MILQSTTTNACGHRFCTACWSKYVNIKIMDEGLSNSILCAATDCDVFVDDEIVIELVDDLPAKRRYQLLIANSLIQVSTCIQTKHLKLPSTGTELNYRTYCGGYKWGLYS